MARIIKICWPDYSCIRFFSSSLQFEPVMTPQLFWSESTVLQFRQKKKKKKKETCSLNFENLCACRTRFTAVDCRRPDHDFSFSGSNIQRYRSNFMWNPDLIYFFVVVLATEKKITCSCIESKSPFNGPSCLTYERDPLSGCRKWWQSLQVDVANTLTCSFVDATYKLNSAYGDKQKYHVICLKTMKTALLYLLRNTRSLDA